MSADLDIDHRTVIGQNVRDAAMRRMDGIRIVNAAESV
jgi:hypothetical protein